MQIINTSEWDYTDAYLGIYYQSANPFYSVNNDYFYNNNRMKTRFIKNEIDAESGEVHNYNLSYNFNSIHPENYKYFGVQFLKTPFAQNDNIDNDGDGMIDEAEGEKLGLTGWHFFPEENMLYYPLREKIQYKILSGDTSGVRNIINRLYFFRNNTS